MMREYAVYHIIALTAGILGDLLIGAPIGCRIRCAPSDIARANVLMLLTEAAVSAVMLGILALIAH